MLTLQEATRIFRYDEETGKLYWNERVHKRIRVGQECGRVTSHGYRKLRVFGKEYYVHRLVWLLKTGSWPNNQIDHINRNRLDNRIENLRVANHFENQHNKSIPKNNTSGIKGVTWNKRAKKWYVQLMFNKKQMYFGLYEDLELAELVIKEARKKYHGEFASC